MQAIVYRGPNDLRVELVRLPTIAPDELLVKVAACGICPTDIKKIQYGTLPPPRIFGHETAGTILRVGKRVKQFKVGDRVALHHHVPCLKCHACRHKVFAQCVTYKRTGITAGFEPAGGGYAEYVRVMSFVLPGVVKIPARNSFLEGAMLEPVNTVLKAVNRLNLLRGDTVLVAGQGPIGLMFTRLLAIRGMRVVATDLLDSRLALAKDFGARWTVNVSPKSKVQSPKWAEADPKSKVQSPKSATDVESRESRVESQRRQVERSADYGSRITDHVSRTTHHSSLSTLVHDISGGRGLDAAVVAVPSDAVVREAQSLVRGGGQVLLFSHTLRGEQTPLDLATVCVDEKDLIGSYSADFTLQEEVARLVFSRKLDVRKLITHQFPLERTAEAIELAAHPTADSLKVVVTQEAKNF